MSGSVSVKVRYYDEACGWTERKSSSFAAAVSTPSASAHSGTTTTTTTNNNNNGGGGGGGGVVANAPSLLTGAANVASTTAATTAAALLIASKNTMVVCSVDMKHMDMADVERFHELVQLHTPAVAILHTVATPVLARLKSNPYTRKTFAVLEMSRSDQHEECTVVLLRLGLHCDPVEASTKSEGKQATRTLAHIHVRNNNNNNSGGHAPSLSVLVLNVDANVTPHRRLGIVRSMLYPAASDVVMQISNITEGLAHADETYRELQGLRTTAGFSDVLDDAAALPSMLSSSSPSTATAAGAAAVGATSTTSAATMTATTWSMWVKSSKYAVVSTTTDLLRGAEPRFIAATLAARAHASATIAIPMPRSGKAARTKSPATGAATATASLHSQATQVLTDPAVLSAEAARTHTLHHGSGPASNSSGSSSNHHHYSGHNTHALHDAAATAPTAAAATTTAHVNKSPHNNMASAALLGGSGGGGGPHASSHHASGSAASASSATHAAATASTGSDLLMRLMRQQQQQQQSSPPPPASSSSSQHSHTNATPPSARWRLAHSFTLKAGEGKLNGAEAAFDVSNLFSSAAEAVDELNLNRLKWPAEFCVVHGTILCSDAVTHCDRPTFRRYVRDKNNNTLAGKLSAAMSAYTAAAAARNAERATVVWPKASVSPADASEEAAGTPGTTTTTTFVAASAAATQAATTAASVASGGSNGSNNSNASNNNATATAGASAAASAAAAAAAAAAVIQRFVARDEAMVVCREWHESCCTIVYQTTPREMKFNVTKLVGLSKDNLKRAIYLLNRTKTSSKESNPLYDYPYDYALLFSVERQGFWLLAATHVPCDIVACRMVA